MTVQQILEAIEELSEEDRRLLVRTIASPIDTMVKKHRVNELAGLGRGIWGSAEEIDAYINEMRDEWDALPHQ